MKMQRKLQADGAGNNAPNKDFREILEYMEKMLKCYIMKN